MCPHSLNGVITSLHVGDDSVVIVGIEPTAIANLATRLGVERRVIKNDFAFFARLQFLHALAVMNNGQHLASVGAGLLVAFEFRFWQSLVSRIRSLFCCTLP